MRPGLPATRFFRLISRAAENQRFLLNANTAHALQHCPTMITAPDGSVLQEIVSAQPAVLRTSIDLSSVSQWYLNQCRSDVVALHYAQSPQRK